MLIFAAFFIVCATILFGAFGQRIQEFLQENVLQMLSRQSFDNIEVEKEVDPSTPSSSSPMTNCGSEFEVFLSFRGADTRKGFTGHLFDALNERGISTFIDSKKLEKGEQIHKLLEYIDKSKIIVVIFSQHYAESKWCLKELAKSVESGKEIVPVFFGVEPSDIRNQEGTFKSVFQEYESNKKLDQAEVKSWRQAFKIVGNLSGFNLKDVNGDEAELKHAIIERVSCIVNRQLLLVAKHPIGIETRVQNVMKMLGNKSKGVHVIGIHGMGGLGKTTIAKAVYNELAEGFNGATCFLSNVRENAGQPNGLVSLQKQVFHEILKDENTYLSNVAHGASLIKERAKHKRVLLILDDVDSIKQIDALAGGRDWFGSGSVIIITTRDYDVLLAGHVKEDEIYMPEVLNQGQSWELFLQHAFNGEEPQEDYHQLSNKVVAAAGGLPLTLEVIGSLLASRKDVQEWKDTLEKLENIPNVDVQKTLKLSYDKLENQEKNIFLDISCFFIGQDRWNATYMWQSHGWFPKEAIKVLIQRALIKINEKTGEFEMHDQLRDMGREIVAEESSRVPQKQSRLWIPQDSLDLLRQKAGTEHVEAIKLYCERENEVYIESFAAMSELRMLQLRNVTLKGKYERFPRKVRWLKWSPQDLHSLPTSLHLDNIGVLDLSGSMIHRVWDQPKVFLHQLKVLCLDYCSNLITCPDFNQMLNLERLSFKKCEKMSGLHPSIGLLKKLTHLNLNGCESLKEFSETIYELTSLEELDLRSCSKITAFPPQLEDSKSREKHVLGKLKVLGFDGCSNLIMCPDFTKMPNLERLSFEDCEKMSELHPSIWCLKRLTSMNLKSCESLEELPQEIGQMTSLKELNLPNFFEISNLPPLPASLIKLDVRNCFQLKELPQEIGQMTSLKELDLSNCSEISNLPPLPPSLNQLDVGGCSRLKELPQEIGQMTSLKKLNLSNCSEISNLPPLPASLIQLDVSYCSRLKELPQEIGQMTSLKELNLSNCSEILNLPPLPASLIQLDVRGCFQLKELPQEIGQITSLQDLYLSNCSEISNLPPLPPSLINLYVKDCSQLESIADVSNVKGLRKLNLMNCVRLVDVPGIDQLVCLERVLLGGCRSLGDLLMERIKVAKFELLQEFSIPGRLINDEWSYSHSITFILPRLSYKGILLLYVDESSIDSICSELGERMSTPPDDQSISNEDEVMIDSQRSRSVVQVDITTDDAQFSFSTFFKSWRSKVPMATFERDSEMMTLVIEGRFEENMVMRVTINGCVILNGDLFIFNFGGEIHDYDDIFYPLEVCQNIVAVKFGNWYD